MQDSASKTAINATGGPKNKAEATRNFYKANFLNVAWELKACKKLLAVNSYMSNDLRQDSVFTKIMDSAHYILQCDRVSLFIVDHVTNTLRCVHSKDDISMPIPIGTGIIGEVAKTGRHLNIRDAYKDTRFFPEVDRRTGYRTKGCLCYPVKFSDSSEVVAVIQAINKKCPPTHTSAELHGYSAKAENSSCNSPRNSTAVQDFYPFTKADESTLSYLADEAANCLQNAKQLEETAKNAQKVNELTEMPRSLSDLVCMSRRLLLQLGQTPRGRHKTHTTTSHKQAPYTIFTSSSFIPLFPECHNG